MLDNDDLKSSIIDDVYVSQYFKKKVFSIVDAVQCMQENCHSTQYDIPGGIIRMRAELNMRVCLKKIYLHLYKYMTHSSTSHTLKIRCFQKYPKLF